jgi:uncharacterized membrane protein
MFRAPFGTRRLLAGFALGAALALIAPACSTTAFYERERIADRAMQLDADGALVYFRNKIEAAREGAFGGFGGSAAGGCGCQ